MKKRILIYSTAYFPLVGGAEVAIKEITDRLGEGFEFVLITARIDNKLPKRERIGNVDVYRMGLGTSFDKLWLAIGGGYLGVKLARKEPFCMVWGVMASFAGLAALRFKELKSEIPFLLTLQEGDDLDDIEKKMRILWWRFRKIFISADCVQVISNYLADWARRMGTTGKIELIPNGVDLSKFQLGQREKNKTIITTSRLVKKNGVSNLIRALLILPSDYKLKILGIGPDELKLKKLTKELKLSSRVSFLGFVSSDKISYHFSQSEIFARPSLSEGLGNSFLEAMAFGLPVVGTPVGGIPDFLEENETGWFCEPNNPRSLVEKIKYITDPNNLNQVDRVVMKARLLVEEKYDWDKIAIKIRAIFEDLLS